MRGAASRRRRSGPRRSTTRTRRSPSPRPTWPTSTGNPRSSSATRPATSTPTTLRAGRRHSGWPYFTGAPVDSTPSVAPINAGGLDTVYVGSGDAAAPTTGGYQAISPGGGDQWFVQETNPGTDPTPHSGIAASMTVGSYAGGYGVEAGSLGQNTDAFSAASGASLGGFPWFSADSVYLDRGRGRSLRRRQQRAHFRWGLDRRGRLRADLLQRRAHSHPLECR